MNQNFKTIKTLLKEYSGEIVLNCPEKRNAISPQMITELTQVLNLWEKEERIKVLVLKGEGKAFCSGADLSYLKELRKFDFNKNFEDSLRLGELFLKIYSYPKPVIAVVQGPTLAGGCGLASVCDLIIATPQAKFGYPEVKIGFVAALVSTFLIRQIGERKARELLITGKIISAEEAARIGLINQVVSENEIQSYVNKLIEEMVDNGPLAIKTTKQLFLDFSYQDISNDIRRLAELNAKFRSTEEFLEGISAFLEKRRPNWQSRTKREERIC